MNQEEQTIKEVPPTTGLPLQGNKKLDLKIIGVVALVIGVVGMNIFFKSDADKKTALKKGEQESFQTENVDPLNGKAVSDSPAPRDTLTGVDNLKQQVEEAKAKDFINRLQAPQSTEVVNTTSNTVASRSMVEASNTSNQANSYGSTQSMNGGMSNDPNTAFLASTSQAGVETAYANRLKNLQWLIGQGKFIFGTLETAINSDLPGQIRAVVNQDIYGEQGRIPLITQGSTLIGMYRSILVNNQSQLLVIWTRVKQPNGVVIMIGSEGTDALGRAGMTGAVDYHFMARFGTATLLSMIGAGASTIGVNPMDRDNSLAFYRQSVTQAMAQQANNTLSQQMNIPPTIKINQGEKVVVFVNRDLDFSRVMR